MRGVAIGNSPDNGAERQDHFEVMDEQDMGTEVEQCVQANGGHGHVQQQSARVEEQSEAADDSVDEGLLVARVRVIDPPEPEDAEDERGQDGQLP